MKEQTLILIPMIDTTCDINQNITFSKPTPHVTTHLHNFIRLGNVPFNGCGCMVW